MSTTDAAPRPPGSARLLFARTVLVSEAFVVLFATLVAHGLRLADRPVVWAAGGAVMLAAVLATAALRRPRVGLVAGSLVQLVLVAGGLVVPMMFVVGVVFALIWVVSLQLGGRIDLERQERYAAEVALRAGGADDAGGADAPDAADAAGDADAADAAGATGQAH
ncbi:DUF4233 domain-containing protein [Georgenia muralis]|uniref:DUF4233 domain-containing protein n=1 Tax=Georgenia muralis TaxID=154117 RepID=UPI000F512716|nr:DUF4233 domain-containing protein [Georgenia muralis]